MSADKPTGLTVSEKHKILVSNGILTKEHIEKIQGAIWYFLYAVDKTTEEYRDKETGQVRGRVLGTMPLNDSDVATVLGVKRRTVRRWREHLTETGYLRTKRTPIGYIVEVANSKKGLLKAESDVTPKAHPSGSDVTQNAHQSPSDVTKSDNRCHQNGHQMSEKVTSLKGDLQDNAALPGFAVTESKQGVNSQSQKKEKRKKEPTQPSKSVSPNDLTLTNPETVADFIQISDDAVLEEIINKISDGEYGINSLDQYDCASELEKACRQAVREKATCPFLGKESCAGIMSRVMDILRVQFGLDVPSPWLPVLKTLREKKGPTTFLKSKPQQLNEKAAQVLTDPESALHFFERELKPFNRALVKTAQNHPVPGSWSEAVHFLDKVLEQNPITELAAVRDQIQKRVAA
jgi:hypothetical protein